MGLLLGGAWWGAQRLWPAGLAAAIVVVLDLAVTGMLHFDGLLDSADGLLSHLLPDRRLAVMAEPTVGAFGVGAGAGVLIVRWAALGALVAHPLLLTGVWMISRSAMAVVPGVLPYAHPEGGLARVFLGDGIKDRRTRRAATTAGSLGIGIGFAALLWWHPIAGAGVCGVEVVGFGAVILLACKRIGGFTGDVLGAAGIVGETVALVVAAARW
jgi:adenosylcobinamide-phosphate synthase/adenosylcobinamide-GDP ribazoletransferase